MKGRRLVSETAAASCPQHPALDPHRLLTPGGEVQPGAGQKRGGRTVVPGHAYATTPHHVSFRMVAPARVVAPARARFHPRPLPPAPVRDSDPAADWDLRAFTELPSLW